MKTRSNAGRGVALTLAIMAAVVSDSPARASDAYPGRPDLVFAQASTDTIAITQAMAQAQERFEGTIIEAELDVGRPHEKTDVVYELRMLTERGDILRIRVDARDGTILEADGRGLVDARRRP